MGDRVSGLVVRDSVSGGVVGDSVSRDVEGDNVGGEGREGAGGSVVVIPHVLVIEIARKINVIDHVSFTFLTCMNSYTYMLCPTHRNYYIHQEITLKILVPKISVIPIRMKNGSAWFAYLLLV